MKKNHPNELIFSLLDNDSFIGWVLNPSPESNVYWEQEMENNNELKDCIYDLKKIIDKMKVDEPTLSGNDKKLIWEYIRQGIDNKQVKKKSFTRIYSRIAAAAVVMGLLAGGYLYMTIADRKADINYLSIIDDTQPSQSGNISLILSDNKVVDIQKDSSNVVYDHKGRVNIDQERVEETDSNKPSLNQLIVPYGKTTALTLSDGTKIWVNSGSKLIYPSVFGKDKREIFLIGEIYLDVTSNKNSPFIIKTDHMDVNVLGTQLNISAYNDENLQSVVLISGAVNVKSKELKGTYNIHPNQMFSYGTKSNKVDIQEVNVDNYISWIHGYLLLERENLDNVLHKLERHFNISFAYNPDEFKNISISGKLDMKGSLETALKYISIAAPIHYTINNDIVEIKLIREK